MGLNDCGERFINYYLKAKIALNMMDDHLWVYLYRIAEVSYWYSSLYANQSRQILYTFTILCIF